MSLKSSIATHHIQQMCQLVQDGHLDLMVKLLDEYPELLNRRREVPNYGNWIHAAVNAGRARLIPELVKRGLDVDYRNRNGSTPLHIAVGFCLERTVRTLLDLGADSTARNREGKTPLFMAAEAGTDEVLRALIEKRPQVDAVCDGVTALFVAAASGSGSASAVRLLLDAGANAEFCRADGCTVLDAAQQTDDPDTVALLRAWIDASRAQAAIQHIQTAGLRSLAPEQ